MRIIYRQTSIRTICEMTWSRLRINEPENMERIVMEDDVYIYTQDSRYKKINDVKVELA